MAKQTLSIIEIKYRGDLYFPSLIDFFQASIEYTKMRELVMHYQHKLALVMFEHLDFLADYPFLKCLL